MYKLSKTNWAKIIYSSLVLREREEKKPKYLAPIRIDCALFCKIYWIAIKKHAFDTIFHSIFDLKYRLHTLVFGFYVSQQFGDILLHICSFLWIGEILNMLLKTKILSFYKQEAVFYSNWIKRKITIFSWFKTINFWLLGFSVHKYLVFHLS